MSVDGDDDVRCWAVMWQAWKSCAMMSKQWIGFCGKRQEELTKQRNEESHCSRPCPVWDAHHNH